MKKPAQPLRIGQNGFALPLKLVTSTQAILARKRSGKSYTASVEAEELLEQKQQIAVIDPTGAWWGLRSLADGTGPGYPVVVFGGDHADASLEPHSGRVLANALVEHRFSAIFDVGLMVTDDQLRFVSDFASELLRINRTALHLFIDEADTFAPQMLEGKAHKVCLGTVSRLVKQGGIRGVGVTMITQRPADLNKKVLRQVDTLTLLRMSHPPDIATATDWIKANVSPEFAREVAEALPALPVGAAFVCSATLDIGERVEVRPRRTFNSGATPEPGEYKAEPKVLASVDIERLGQEIAASAKRAQESSPEFLRRRIAELEREGKGGGSGACAEEVARLRAEAERYKAAAERAAAREAEIDAVERIHRETVEALRVLVGRLDRSGPPQKVKTPVTPIKEAASTPTPRPAARPPRAHVEALTHDGVSTGEQKILDALANLEAVGVTSPPKSQVSAFAGYSNPNSGGFAKPAAALKQKGMIHSSGGMAELTDAGREAVHMPTRPKTTKELQERISALLGEGERKLLTLLIAAYPETLPRAELSQRAGYSNVNSGGFAKPLARLLALGFAEAAGTGIVRGSDMLVLKRKAR